METHMMRHWICLPLLGLIGLCVQPATQAADDDGFVTIKGQVVLAGDGGIPEVKAIVPSQDKAHCESKGVLLEQRLLVDKKTRGVKNVFVWLGPYSTDRIAKFPQDKIHPSLTKAPKDPVIIDQPCCMFVQHAVAAREGQNLIVKNSSPVPHNANWTSKENGSGNLLIPPGGKLDFDAPLNADRLPMEVKCSIHPWMNAWVRVFDHPYFAVTDEQGNFEIKMAPKGTFRIFYWHEVPGYKGGREGRNGEVIELKGKVVDQGKVELGLE